LNLDRELNTVDARRLVHLSDRSRREGLLIKDSKQFFGKSSELATNDLAGLAIRKGPGIAQKLQEFVAVFSWQQIEPQREALSELDPSTPKMLGGLTETLGQRSSSRGGLKLRQHDEPHRRRDQLEKPSGQLKRAREPLQ